MPPDQVDVELGRVLEALVVEARLPVLVEPGAAEGVHHGGQRRHRLAPAGQPAQADALHALLGAVDLRREVRDLLPGRVLRHLQALLGEDVLAVHQEGRLAVERFAVQLPVLAGERLAHGGEDVLLVEGLVLGDVRAERAQPAVAGVDRDLVVGEGRDVVLARLVGEVLADLVADVVLRQHREVHLDAGLPREMAGGELLQLDHLRVVDHQDVEGVTARAEPAGARPAAGQEGVNSVPAAAITSRGPGGLRRLWVRIDAPGRKGWRGFTGMKRYVDGCAEPAPVPVEPWVDQTRMTCGPISE